MTTESKEHHAVARPRWTPEQFSAERERNKMHWADHEDELRGQFPHHWIVVYAGDQVAAFEDGQSLIEQLNEFDDFTRGCSYWKPPRGDRRRHVVTNVRMRR